MNIKLTSISYILTIFLFAQSGLADDCSHLWQAELQTGQAVTRGMSGDTHAAYALLSFRPTSHVSLVIAGRLPQARFFSFESYKSRLLTGHAALLDYQIKPEDADDTYRIEASTGSQKLPGVANFLQLPDSFLQPQSIMLRIYEPANSLTMDDLPRVYAVDDRTGASRACPTQVNIPFRFDGPQIIGALAPFHSRLDFGQSKVFSGQNSAMPGYAVILTQMLPTNAAFIRFAEPSARYYSLCVQDFLENTTLACLSDREAHKSSDGFIYIAVSENQQLLQAAAARGWNPLAFERSARQRVIGFVYRQVLPDRSEPFEGAFMPVGQVCSLETLLASQCL